MKTARSLMAVAVLCTLGAPPAESAEPGWRARDLRKSQIRLHVRDRVIAYPELRPPRYLPRWAIQPCQGRRC